VSQRVVLEPKLHSLISASNEEGCVPFGLNICYPGVTTGATQIQWDFGNGITSRTLCDSAHYDQPGIYNARLIVTDTTFCNFRDTSFITIHAKVSPQASFNLPDSQNVLYPVIFDNVSSNGVSYSWDFDDQHYSFFENPDHQYTQPGIYTICMTATNDNCIDTACRELKVYENPQAIWFPKAFSPNGDGKNDVFFADGIGITSMQMIIYNRWGLKLFETNTPGNGWDGSYKGSLVESGVYVVYFNAILLNGENEEQYSTVTVYR
jgi:gliding motility-associated-like protein